LNGINLLERFAIISPKDRVLFIKDRYM